MASPSSWWPRQIPKIGNWPSDSVRIVSIAYPTAAGSPGPFDRNTPSGLRSRTCSAVVAAGTTGARDARAIRLHVFRIDAVIADHRRGHHHDLPEIRGIGKDFLVSAQVCGEDDFRVGWLERERRSSGEPGAVL